MVNSSSSSHPPFVFKMSSLFFFKVIFLQKALTQQWIHQCHSIQRIGCLSAHRATALFFKGKGKSSVLNCSVTPKKKTISPVIWFHVVTHCVCTWRGRKVGSCKRDGSQTMAFYSTYVVKLQPWWYLLLLTEPMVKQPVARNMMWNADLGLL